MKLKTAFFILSVVVGSVLNVGCASMQTKSADYIVIKPNEQTAPRPTVILAHGCDGFSRIDGLSYKNRAYLIAQSSNYNVVLYDAFKPRGILADEVCTGARGANPVPPIHRVEDSKQIARWIQTQPWHRGKISFVGYSHGGSVAMAIANDEEASKLISSSVAYYPKCDESYIGSRINKPRIPTLVHLGEDDNWTPMRYCLPYKDHPNYTMHIYKNATHAWELGFNIMAIGKWPVRYNPEATQEAANRTREFFRKTLGE